jgi:hypothetical protein
VGREESRDLAPAEEIRAAGVRGELTNVWLHGDHLELVLRGSVERLSTGAAEGRTDLTPSLLAWLVADQPQWLALAGVTYAGVVALVLAGGVKRSKS